jgi:hypothetical protein
VITRTSDTDHTSPTAYWIAFGPHGPRALAPPGETTKVIIYTILGVIASGGLFAFTRYFASGEVPRTMTKEWQEASEEYLKVHCTRYSRRVFTTSKTNPHAHRHKDPSPSPATRACSSRASLAPRVNSTTKSKAAPEDFCSTQTPFPIVDCPSGDVCIKGGIIIQRWHSFLSDHCHTYSPMYRILEAFLEIPPLCVRRLVFRQPLPTFSAKKRHRRKAPLIYSHISSVLLCWAWILSPLLPQLLSAGKH